MGSEGYLINQFLATRTNKRSDRWGGPFDARMALPVEIVRAVRAATHDQFVIIFRLSMLDLVPDGSARCCCCCCRCWSCCCCCCCCYCCLSCARARVRE